MKLKPVYFFTLIVFLSNNFINPQSNDVNMPKINELDYLSNIFEKFLGFKKSELPIGDLLIEIPSPKEAILLSIYAEIPFLVEKFKGISLLEPLKVQGPLAKILISEDWDLSVPLPTLIDYSPLKQLYSRLFEGKKFLTILKYRSNGASLKYLRKLKQEKLKSVFDQIEKTKMPWEKFLFKSFYGNEKEFYIPEGFFQYFAGVVLKRRGYLITSSFSGADLDAFLIPKLCEINEGEGCFLAEILLDESLKKKVKELQLRKEDIVEVITIEVESSPGRTRSYSENAGFGQLEKYLREYDKGVVAGPLCFENGAISFREDGRLFFKGFVRGGVCKVQIKEGLIDFLKAV